MHIGHGRHHLRISKEGLELIAEFEGFCDHVYKCSAGKNTIAFGHVVKPGESFKIPITKVDAYKLLAKDVKIAEDAVNKNVKVKLNQWQFDSLCSLCFNIGANAFKESTMVRLLNQGRFSEAADQFIRWNRTGGKRIPGLERRRLDERKVFLAVSLI